MNAPFRAPDRLRTASGPRSRGDGPVAPRAPILLVLHQAHSTPGRVGRLLEERGHGLDIRRPALGDELPATLAGHAGAVVFGGPMSANDPDEWVKREIDWISVPLREGKPFLGICLGAQMLAKQLGGRVTCHDEGRMEAGYYPIRPTASGAAFADALGAAWPGHVYHWHREGTICAPGCTLLAEGDDFPEQAFRCGDNAFGLQFHPEVTYATMVRWTTRSVAKLAQAGAQPPHEHLAGWFRHDRAVRLWLDGFLDAWLEGRAAAGGGSSGGGLSEPIASDLMFCAAPHDATACGPGARAGAARGPAEASPARA